MLECDPSLGAQTSERGFGILWRDSGTAREGFLFNVTGCANPECTCREVSLYGGLINSSTQRAGLSGSRLVIEKPVGSPDLGQALDFTVDIDTGEIPAPEGETRTTDLAGFSDAIDATVLDWLHNLWDATRGRRTEVAAPAGGAGNRRPGTARAERAVPVRQREEVQALLRQQASGDIIDSRFVSWPWPPATMT